MESKVGFYDKEGWDGDVYWKLQQKSHTHFQILAKNVRRGWMHSDSYELVQDPIFGIDAQDLASLNEKLAKAVTIAKEGKL